MAVADPGTCNSSDSEERVRERDDGDDPPMKTGKKALYEGIPPEKDNLIYFIMLKQVLLNSFINALYLKPLTVQIDNLIYKRSIRQDELHLRIL